MRKGFTLIELLVVVALVGVLAALAMNYFRHSRLRAHRTEATNVLTAIAKSELVYFHEHGFYTDDLGLLGYETCEDHYCYRVITGDDVFQRENGSYIAVAFGNIEPSDELLDVLVIGNDLQVIPGE